MKTQVIERFTQPPIGRVELVRNDFATPGMRPDYSLYVDNELIDILDTLAEGRAAYDCLWFAAEAGLDSMGGCSHE